MNQHSFHLLCYGWIGVALASFALLLRVAAPYGRHHRRGWGPSINQRLGWVLMELPAVIAIAAFAWGGPLPWSKTTIAMLALWQLHYLNRALIFPLRIRSGGKRTPVAIIGSAIFFNVVNGFIQGRQLTYFGSPSDALLEPTFILGTALFLCGLAINLHADAVLRQLRGPGENNYAIPQGGLYRYVSCPNYLGELIEWSAWALLSRSLAGLTFTIWTAANLVPRALSHHRWYREQFAGYPKQRRALIPGLL
ncbi:MAG: DUF1295 domain-containing protein [Deltaproteobacteria bacterium]|nr:DUF1295 domain-containing protein [Deltaproteobacteria bacterium]